MRTKGGNRGTDRVSGGRVSRGRRIPHTWRRKSINMREDVYVLWRNCQLRMGLSHLTDSEYARRLISVICSEGDAEQERSSLVEVPVVSSAPIVHSSTARKRSYIDQFGGRNQLGNSEDGSDDSDSDVDVVGSPAQAHLRSSSVSVEDDLLQESTALTFESHVAEQSGLLLLSVNPCIELLNGDQYIICEEDKSECESSSEVAGLSSICVDSVVSLKDASVCDGLGSCTGMRPRSPLLSTSASLRVGSMMASRRLVQYLVIRRDLSEKLNWPVGAVIAQCCHACSAVLHQHYGDSNTVQYLADVDNMHKVVLEVTDEEGLLSIAADLTKNKVDHKLWIEQPENFPTCIAVKPYCKEEVQKYFKKCKLYK